MHLFDSVLSFITFQFGKGKSTIKVEWETASRQQITSGRATTTAHSEKSFVQNNEQTNSCRKFFVQFVVVLVNFVSIFLAFLLFFDYFAWQSHSTLKTRIFYRTDEKQGKSIWKTAFIGKTIQIAGGRVLLFA